jgi:hypothetical protein
VTVTAHSWSREPQNRIMRRKMNPPRMSPNPARRAMESGGSF